MSKYSQSRNRRNWLTHWICAKLPLVMATNKEPWLGHKHSNSRATDKIFQWSLNNGEMITLKTSILTAQRSAINHDGKKVMKCVKMQTILECKCISYGIFVIMSQWKQVAPLFHKCLRAECISCRVCALYVKSQIGSVRTSVVSQWAHNTMLGQLLTLLWLCD